MVEILEPFLYYKYNCKNLNNIDFEISDFTFEKNVMINEFEHEGILTDYHSIIKVDNKIQIYYRSGNVDIELLKSFHSEEITKYQLTCYAESNDGINFIKPNLNIIEYNGNRDNNIIISKEYSHNFLPFYDENNNNYIAICGTQFDSNGIHLFNSNNGIKWNYINKIIDENYINSGWYHPNHFDSLNVILYNKLEELYYIYIRDNQIDIPYRRIQLSKSKDLINFEKCIPVKINYNCFDERCIYYPGISIYPESKYFISITIISTNTNNDNFKNITFNKTSALMISNDGINFDLIKINIFNSNEYQIPAYRFININNKFYFYINCRKEWGENSILKCYSQILDRIGYLKSDTEGTFITKNIYLNNSNIFINFKTEEDGYIMVELYDINNNLILRSELIKGDNIRKKIEWLQDYNIDINYNQEYYLKFTLNKSKIYSFLYY